MGNWRGPHGNKRDLHGPGGVTWENALTDPAPKVPAGAGVEIKRDEGGHVRDTESARALALLRNAVPNYVARAIVCSEAFADYNDTRKVWTRSRVTELYLQTGTVSRGVGARTRAAGWGFAFGEYLCAEAARTNDPELMDWALSILAKASTEDEKARRLAIDEAKSRPKESRTTQLTRELLAEGKAKP